MKVTFTGKQDKLNPSQERKLALAFARLSKAVWKDPWRYRPEDERAKKVVE